MADLEGQEKDGKIYSYIKVAKLPYRIKLKVMPVAYKSSDGLMVDLVIYNQGNIETGIDHISIADNKKLVLGMYRGERVFIKPGHTQKCRIEIFDRTEYIEENTIDLNNKIVVTIHDSYGNEYVFKNGFPVG